MRVDICVAYLSHPGMWVWLRSTTWQIWYLVAPDAGPEGRADSGVVFVKLDKRRDYFGHLATNIEPKVVPIALTTLTKSSWAVGLTNG